MARSIKAYFTPAALSGLILIPGFSNAQETLFPQGFNIDVIYALHQTDFGDYYVFTVYRTVANNELFDLSGLYFSENVPGEFKVKTTSVTIDGDSIGTFFSGPIDDETIPGYSTFRWIIDFPSDHGNIHNVVHPGQRVTLRYDIGFPPGNYALPFHTVCFYGGGNGFFTTADTILIPLDPREIPTLGQWGATALALSILGVATAALINRRSSRPRISV